MAFAQGVNDYRIGDSRDFEAAPDRDQKGLRDTEYRNTLKYLLFCRVTDRAAL